MNIYRVSVDGREIGEYVGQGKWDAINATLWREGRVPQGHMAVPLGTRIIEDAVGIIELEMPDGVCYRGEWIRDNQIEKEGWRLLPG